MIIYNENEKKILLEGEKQDIIQQCIDILILVRNADPGSIPAKNYEILKEVVKGLDNTYFHKRDYEVVFTESVAEQLAYTE